MRIKSRDKLKILAKIFNLIGAAILISLIVLPLYPLVSYEMSSKPTLAAGNNQKIEDAKKYTEKIIAKLPKNNDKVTGNRIIISKIGVNMPIVESKIAKVGLSKGAWRMPQTSTPDKGSNTVITGHRYKYLPPSSLTFFLLNKLTKGDIISVVWNGKKYYYEVKETKIVKPTQVSILNPSEKPKLTIFTCDPVFTSKNRLVVVAEPIDI